MISSPAHPLPRPPAAQRYKLVHELLTSEKVHRDNLSAVVTHYFKPLTEQAIITKLGALLVPLSCRLVSSLSAGICSFTPALSSLASWKQYILLLFVITLCPILRYPGRVFG